VYFRFFRFEGNVVFKIKTVIVFAEFIQHSHGFLFSFAQSGLALTHTMMCPYCRAEARGCQLRRFQV
jgi:hypothetical protein